MPYKHTFREIKRHFKIKKAIQVLLEWLLSLFYLFFIEGRFFFIF